jgi:hypothetical protein
MSELQLEIGVSWWIGNKGRVQAPWFGDQDVASEAQRPITAGRLPGAVSEHRSLTGNAAALCARR